MKNILMMTIEEVSKLIESKEISPVELTNNCLSRIEKYKTGDG